MHSWFLLPHLAGLKIVGKDALDFCQSQFTADLRPLPLARWQITSWCNPKGRVLTVILTSRHENHVEIVAPRDQIDILAKLAIYSIGRSISIEPVDSVSGTLSAKADDHWIVADQSRAIRLSHSDPEPEPAQLNAWRLADLATPIPWLTSQTSAMFLPQALGMESNDGLSYAKGCFPGQEIIARVHYLGQVKYQLMGFELDPPWPSTISLETMQLQSSVDFDQSTVITVLAAVQTHSAIVGLAVAPTQLHDKHPITSTGRDWTRPGRMTSPERLCYYRGKILTN